MTIVALTTFHPRPGAAWDDVRKHAERVCDLARKHGAENVTVLATKMGEPAANTIALLCSTEDPTLYGKVQQALMDHPERQALLVEACQIATWETYVSQTFSDMLALWVSLTVRPGQMIRVLSSGSVRRLRFADTIAYVNEPVKTLSTVAR